MSDYRPHMLPKVRSRVLMDAVGGKIAGQPQDLPMPCTLRISGLVPGHKCASRETSVFCHLGNLGKGTSTKVSDLNGAAGCDHCHALVDGRDNRWWSVIVADPKLHIIALQRCLTAVFETQAMLVQREIISVRGMKLI